MKNGLHLLKGVKNVETIALKTKNKLHKVVALEITCTRTIFVLTVIYTGAMPFGTVPIFLLVPVSQLPKRFQWKNCRKSSVELNCPKWCFTFSGLFEDICTKEIRGIFYFLKSLKIRPKRHCLWEHSSISYSNGRYVTLKVILRTLQLCIFCLKT